MKRKITLLKQRVTFLLTAALLLSSFPSMAYEDEPNVSDESAVFLSGDDDGASGEESDVSDIEASYHAEDDESVIDTTDESREDTTEQEEEMKEDEENDPSEILPEENDSEKPLFLSSISDLEGSGKENDPWIITDSSDWKTFIGYLNSGVSFRGRYLKLSNSFNNENNPITSTFNEDGADFCGSFDGNGKTVYVDINDTSQQGTALFRSVSEGAYIKNLTVKGRVTGKKFAGGLVGFSRGGSESAPNIVEHCCIDVAVTVPELDDDGYVGGVVGHGLNSYISIIDTSFTGTITNTKDYAGGLIGWCDGGCHMSFDYCLFSGTYEGTAAFHPVALTGSSDISAEGSAFYLGDASDIPDSKIAFSGKKAYTEPDDNDLYEETSACGNTLYVPCNAEIVIEEEYAYTGSVITVVPVVQSGETVLSDRKYSVGIDPSVVCNPGKYRIYVTGVNSEGFYGSKYTEFTVVRSTGDGSIDDPYIIEDQYGWISFAKEVNAGNSYSGKYIKLADNFGNPGVPGDAFIDAITVTIGTSEHPFSGTFDGNGKTVIVNISDTSNQGTAPFRYIADGAVIKNLTVEGAVSGSTHAAGLVGFSSGGLEDSPNTIENCIVNADITVPATDGDRHMGGIVGHGLNSALKIKDCVFCGSMSNSGNHAGGLMGWCDGNCNLTLDNCLFKGTYTGTANFHPIAVRSNNAKVTVTDNGAYYLSRANLSDAGYIACEGTEASEDAPIEGILNIKKRLADGRDYYVDAGVTIEGIDAPYVYSDHDISLVFRLMIGSRELEQGTDYTYTLTPQVINRPGIYTLTINGAEEQGYYGETAVMFTVIRSLQGDGTSVSPYIIANNDDWELFGYQLESGYSFKDEYVKLSNSFNNSGNPITRMAGSEGHEFEGTFDGNGKTVYVNIVNSAPSYLGLFSGIRDGAVIKNLTLEGTVSYDGARDYRKCIGAIAGCVFGGSEDSPNIIENCTVNTDIINGYYSGVMFGYSESTYIKLTGDIFTGNLTGTRGWQSGMAGFCNNNTNLTVKNCLFKGHGDSGSNFHPLGVKEYYKNVPVSIENFYYTQERSTYNNIYQLTDGSYGTRVYSDIPDNTIAERKQIFTGETYYVVVADGSGAITDVEDRYAATGSVISIEPVLNINGAQAETGLYTVSIDPSTVKDPGVYTLTIHMRSTSGYYGSISRTFIVYGLSGQGTSNDPYLINNAADWEYFGYCLAGGKDYSGEYVSLSSDFSGTVTTVADGTFKGIFNGNNRTLDVNIDRPGVTSAPFVAISDGAVIKNLTVTGNVKGGACSGGLVAQCYGGSSEEPNLIENCIVRTSVSTIDGTTLYGTYAGGILGCATDSAVKLKNCIYTGKVSARGGSSECSGGLVGRSVASYQKRAYVYLEDCVYAGQYSGSYSFHPLASRANNNTISWDFTNAYYTVDPTATNNLTYLSGGTKVLADISEREGIYKTYTAVDDTVFYFPSETTVEGVDEYYSYTGETINLEPVVKIDGTELDSGNYTFTVNPASVRDKGEYAVTFTGKEENGYAGTLVKKFQVCLLDGNGTANDPYIIKNAGDWDSAAIFFNRDETGIYSGKYYKLSDTFDNTDEPVGTMFGTPEHHFDGTIDGNGRTLNVNIQHFEDGSGIVRYAGSGTVVKNLNLEGEVNGMFYTGGVIGVLDGGSEQKPVLIENCRINVYVHKDTFVSDESKRVGGVVGILLSTSYFKAKDVIFEGTAKNNGAVSGGLVGLCEEYSHLTIDNYLCLGDQSFYPVATRAHWETVHVNANRVYYTTSNAYDTVWYMVYEGTRIFSEVPEDGFSKKITALDGNEYYAKGSTELSTTYEAVYTGERFVVDPVLKYDGELLVKGRDYSVTATPAPVCDVGKYTVTIKGINAAGYYGEKSYQLSIHDFVSSGGGTGTESDPYIISDVQDFNEFGSYVNAGMTFKGKYFKLSDDFDNSGPEGDELKNAIQTPVGTQNNGFEGVFDGNGRSLYVNFGSTTNEGNAPFVRIQNGAVIRNLTVCGDVNGWDYAGGLVGFSEGGTADHPNTIENCVVSARVISRDNVGNSWYSGGVVGHGRNSHLLIKNTVFNGSILYSRHIGGLIGWCDGGCSLTVEGCLYKGAYTCNSYASDAYQYHPFALKTSNADVTVSVSETYVIGSEPYKNEDTSKIVADLPIAYSELPEGQGFYNKRTLADGEMYYVAGEASISGVGSFKYTGETITLTPTVTFNDEVLTAETEYTFTTSPEPVKEEGTYTLTVTGVNEGGYYGSISTSFNVVDKEMLAGSGTKEDPFLVESQEDWVKFADLVKSGFTFEDMYVKLTKDIDFSGNTETSAYAVGSSSKPFKGTFDGGGHYLDRLSQDDESVDETAVFRAIEGAVIKNLELKDLCSMRGGEHTAGLVGRSLGKGNVIENCKLYTYVYANGNYGAGVVGYVNSSEVTIRNCIVSSRIHIVGAYSKYALFANDVTEKGSVKIIDCLFLKPSYGSTYRKSTFFVWGSGGKQEIITSYKDEDVCDQGTMAYREAPEGLSLKKTLTDGNDWYISCNVTGPAKEYDYTKDVIDIPVTVTCEGEELINGEDYAVNTVPVVVHNYGKYELTVKGIGNCSGELSFEFEVLKPVQNTEDLSSKDVVWYGGLQWYVISDSNDDTLPVSGQGRMLLLSKDRIWDEKPFDDSETPTAVWADSSLRTWCKDLYSGWSNSAEKTYILATTVTETEGSTINDISYAPASLADDRFFMLSAKEANTYLPEAEKRKTGTDWWLRSAGTEGGVGMVSDGNFALVSADDLKDARKGARAAFNLDAAGVLALRRSDSKAVEGEGIISPYVEKTNTDWKFVLYDEAEHGNFNVLNSTLKISGGALSIPYSGASAGANEYITVQVYDEQNILIYEGFKSVKAESGIVEIQAPKEIASQDYRVVVFNDRKNSPQESDLSGRFIEVKVEVDETGDEEDPTADVIEIEGLDDASVVETVRKIYEDGSIETTILVDGQAIRKLVTDKDGNVLSIETQIWVAGLHDDYHYTGAAIKPAPNVYDGIKRLKAGTDYTVSYSSNKNVGQKATVTVKFKGNYKGNISKKLYFTISAAVIGTDVLVEDAFVAGTGKKQSPIPILTMAATGKSVSKGNFKFEYSPETVKDPGKYTVKVTSKNKSFTGEAQSVITVVDKTLLLSKATVTMNPKKFIWTGKEITPAEGKYSLKIGNKQLVEGTDYSVIAVTNNVNVGKAVITFGAIPGNEAGYEGTKSYVFSIVKGRVISADNGFTITCSPNVPYEKGGAKPKVSVKDGNKLLVEGRDYTASYSKNSKVTSDKPATVKIKGKGNYKGTLQTQFNVVKKDISLLAGNVIVQDKAESKKGYKNPSVVITDLNGKKLSLNTDFVIDDYSVSEDGMTVSAFAVGKGNYEGRTSITYKYLKASRFLSKVKANKIVQKTYTGRSVELSKEELGTLLYTQDKKTKTYLVYGTDFEVLSYTGNIKKGTAKVTLRGIGSYGGTKTLSFKIISRNADAKGSLIDGIWKLFGN
ncbi:MAG: DUF6273 domain-containing protein [Butyrivibrio sp.]|nr:DUF6273 domain-containing protein [Butyrivibrio sp.]